MEFNGNFSKLAENYLFAETESRVAAYRNLHPDKKIIKLGIGDVTLPLPPQIVGALISASAEMGKEDTFRGYPPYEGLDFLRGKISEYYAGLGASVGADEIFVSDGAKSDLGNITDIFPKGCTALIPDPVYPAYAEAEIIAGNRVVFAEGNEENGFLPMPAANTRADLIYICSPNNPTGAAYTAAQLEEWVDFANRTGAVILYDAAYERFISDPRCPRTIFFTEAAKTCAIEFCSLSKTAGFTGTRCGYTVVPKRLIRGGLSANRLWLRRQSAKFNGVSYPVQRAAEAVFTPQGLVSTQKNVDYYKGNAGIISNALSSAGINCRGGENSPYIWLKCPRGMTSMEFFVFLLEEAQIAGTAGSGFGGRGEGYMRLSCFCSRESALEAANRIKNLFARGRL